MCPVGTFSTVPGLPREADCQPCPAGFYCGEPGLRAPTGPCSHGLFMYHNRIYAVSLSFSCYTTLSFGQATGVPLVRLWMQLCRVLQATSAHRVAQLQNHAHQEHIRTERNRQTVPSVYQVAAFSDIKKVHFIVFFKLSLATDVFVFKDSTVTHD